MPPSERRVDDAAVLTALAHPLRRRIIDLLTLEGPATASALAARTGQLVGNISHHAGVLERAGLIHVAEELAKDRRERWWQTVPTRLSWSSAADRSPADAVIADAAEAVNVDHHLSKLRRWRADRDTMPEWVDAAFAADTWLRLSVDELDAFGAQLRELFVRWADREIPDDGAERHPVFAFAHAVPSTP